MEENQGVATISPGLLIKGYRVMLFLQPLASIIKSGAFCIYIDFKHVWWTKYHFPTLKISEMWLVFIIDLYLTRTSRFSFYKLGTRVWDLLRYSWPVLWIMQYWYPAHVMPKSIIFPGEIGEVKFSILYILSYRNKAFSQVFKNADCIKLQRNSIQRLNT